MKREDTIIGNIYSVEIDSTAYIMKAGKWGEINNICIGTRRWHVRTGYFKTEDLEFTPATELEIAWFEACERENKFIPLEEIKLTEYSIY